MTLDEVKPRVRAIMEEFGLQDEDVDGEAGSVHAMIADGKPADKVFDAFRRYCGGYKNEKDGKPFDPDGRDSRISSVWQGMSWGPDETCPVCNERKGEIALKGHSRANGNILETSRSYCVECYNSRRGDCQKHWEAYWDETWQKQIKRCEANYVKYGIYGNCWYSNQDRPSMHFCGKPPQEFLDRLKAEGIEPAVAVPDSEWPKGREFTQRFHISVRIPEDIKKDGRIVRKMRPDEPRVKVVMDWMPDGVNYGDHVEVCEWPVPEDTYDFYFVRAVCFADSPEEVVRLCNEYKEGRWQSS